jgi:hypothetical protein
MRRRAILAALLAGAPRRTQADGALATAFPPPFPFEPGPLRPLGWLEVDRARLGFGGLSGLHLAPDLTLTAVSDLARFAQFRLVLDAALQPVGLELLRTGPLRDGSGRPLARGYTGDAEALVRLPDGSWLVAFERWHRIRRYRDLDGPGDFAPAPPGIERAPANAGLESLALLADGRWLAIAEDMAVPDLPGATAAWLRGPAGWMRLAWRPASGMNPVDAVGLPDGGALVLERGFSFLAGFSGRITRIPATALDAAAPGSVLQGEELLRFWPPLPVENFEGIAVTRHAGRLLVTVVSDDNQSRFQSTILALFELVA